MTFTHELERFIVPVKFRLVPDEAVLAASLEWLTRDSHVSGVKRKLFDDNDGGEACDVSSKQERTSTPLKAREMAAQTLIDNANQLKRWFSNEFQRKIIIQQATVLEKNFIFKKKLFFSSLLFLLL